MTSMKRTPVLLAAAILFVVPSLAQAKPSLDQRIRAIAHRVQVLEQQNDELRDDLKAERADLDEQRVAATAARQRFSSLLNCLMLAPAGRSVAGVGSVLQPFGPDLAVYFHPSCSSPIMPPQSDEFSVHPTQLHFSY